MAKKSAARKRAAKKTSSRKSSKTPSRGRRRSGEARKSGGARKSSRKRTAAKSSKRTAAKSSKPRARKSAARKRAIRNPIRRATPAAVAAPVMDAGIEPFEAQSDTGEWAEGSEPYASSDEDDLGPAFDADADED